MKTICYKYDVDDVDGYRIDCKTGVQLTPSPPKIQQPVANGVIDYIEDKQTNVWCDITIGYRS